MIIISRCIITLKINCIYYLRCKHFKKWKAEGKTKLKISWSPLHKQFFINHCRHKLRHNSINNLITKQQFIPKKKSFIIAPPEILHRQRKINRWSRKIENSWTDTFKLKERHLKNFLEIAMRYNDIGFVEPDSGQLEYFSRLTVSFFRT